MPPLFSTRARPVVGRVVEPVIEQLVKAGITPNTVTALGTIGVVAGALVFYPRGHFLVGTLVITVFTFTDFLDGALARRLGTSGPFGAWLDSTCDRFGDAAVFGSLAWWYSAGGHSRLLEAVSLLVLVLSGVVSYAKARAEGLGLSANVGIAERSVRLIVVLAAAGFTGLGVPDGLLAGALWALLAATAITVGQRTVEVHKQATASL